MGRLVTGVVADKTGRPVLVQGVECFGAGVVCMCMAATESLPALAVLCFLCESSSIGLPAQSMVNRASIHSSLLSQTVSLY